MCNTTAALASSRMARRGCVRSKWSPSGPPKAQPGRPPHPRSRLGVLFGRHRERCPPRSRPEPLRLRPVRAPRGRPARLHPSPTPSDPRRRRRLDLADRRRRLSRDPACRRSLARQGTPLAHGQSALPRHPYQPRGLGRARCDDLEQGRFDSLLANLRSHAATCPSAGQCADYLAKNRSRMCCPEFRAQGLCLGAGVAESGCKTVAGARLKQADMHWTVSGASAILALRCCVLSGGYEDYWAQRADPPVSK